MGNIDKGLYEYKGKVLIDWVIESLQSACQTLLISCNQNIDQYRQRQFPVIQDVQTNTAIQFEGPIAGIVSAIPYVKTNYLLICPCDTPNIPINMAEELYTAIKANPVDVAVINDGVRQHNLHCLIKTRQLESLNGFYQSGGRAIREWFKTVNITVVNYNSKTAFQNINSHAFN